MDQTQNNTDQDAKQNEPFELTISARIVDNGVQTGITHSGKPNASREIEALPVNIAARALSFMYDAALVGNKREDTPAERAIFFTAMQPAIMNAFLGITDSWQFRKTLAEHREISQKAQTHKAAPKAVAPKAPTEKVPA